MRQRQSPRLKDESLVWFGPLIRPFEEFVSDPLFGKRGLYESICQELPQDQRSAVLTTIHAMDIFNGIKRHRLSKNVQGKIDLLDILSSAQIVFKAANPRDKLLALLPLFEHDLRTTRNPITVDVYCEFAHDIIDHDRTLDILAIAGVQGEVDVPSWVPDWTADTTPKPFIRKALEPRTGTKATTYKASNGTTFNGRIDDRQRKLYTPGLQYGIVREVLSSRHSGVVSYDSISEEWLERRSEAAFYPLRPTCQYKALSHALTADVLHGSRRAPDKEYNVASLFGSPDCMDATVGRAPLFTVKGHMGLGPYTTLVGDKVCLLEGAQCPMILRDRMDGSWTFVGEAYVHGIMDGEVWKGRESDLQTFIIE